MTVSIGGLRPPITRFRRCPPSTFLVLLVMGLALPAPSAFAHGNQFLCARLTISDDGRVALELTADHGDNPNIADAAEAQQVLRECLQVCIGDKRFPLEHFAPLAFSERTRYSDDSPVPPTAESLPHRLVTATWAADLPGRSFTFAAKDRTPLDVVMWRGDQAPSPGGSRWMLLIAGDRSPEFTAAVRATPWWIAVLPAVAVALLGWRLRRRRPVHHATPTAPAAETSATNQQ